MKNNKVFDYVIIGTGIMSSVAYKTLLDKNYDIKVINIEKLPALQNEKNNKFDFKKGTIFYGKGGTSNIWSSTYDLYPNNYLPMFLDNILSNEKIKSVHNILRHFDVPLRKILNTNVNKKDFFMSDVNGVEVNFAIRNKELFNFYEVFNKKDIWDVDLKNLEINHNEQKIEDQLSNEKVYYKTLVLTAGGIGNSFLINRYFKNNKNNGKNYMNHLKFSPLVFKTNKRLRISKVTGTRKLDNYEIIPTYLIKDENDKLLHSYRIYTSLRTEVEKKSNYLSLIVDKIFRKVGFSKFFKILVYTDMKPGKNYLEFTNNETILNSTKDTTIENISNFINAIHRDLRQHPNVKKVVNKVNYEINEGSHHIGTTIMGEHADNSVVNLNSNLYGYDNIKVFGTSVLPQAGSGHPTLTAMILTILELEKNLND